MPLPETMRLAKTIRDRRRAMDLTQQELASRIGVSTAYVGHVESVKRLPSYKVLIAMARVLGLDWRELFILANPEPAAIVSAPAEKTRKSSWDKFLKNVQLRQLHHITDRELEILSRVAARAKCAARTISFTFSSPFETRSSKLSSCKWAVRLRFACPTTFSCGSSG